MPTSTDPLLRAAHYLRVRRAAVDDAERPIDKRLAWTELKASCAMLGVMHQDDLWGPYYVAAVERVWESRAAQRPRGPVGIVKFREWADDFDGELAERLGRLASGDMEARF